MEPEINKVELEQRIDDVLQAQLAQVALEQGVASDGPFKAMQLATAHAVLRAFRSTGMIDDDAAARWASRFDQAGLKSSSNSIHQETRAIKVPLSNVVHSRRRRRAKTPSASQRESLDLSRPVMTFTVTPTPTTDVLIRAIELYSGAVAVLWTQLGQPEEGFAKLLHVKLEDDSGTAYERVRAGGQDARWEHIFAPGVPDGATRLTLSIGVDRFEIDLPAEVGSGRV